MSPSDMMPPRPRWSSQISMGNVIQIVGMLVLAAAGYARLEVTTTSLIDRTEAQEEAITELARRVRTLETDQARADERMASILTLLGRIDARLERIERK